MGKAYRRIIQDEIEAKGWTVTRALPRQASFLGITLDNESIRALFSSGVAYRGGESRM